MTAASLGVRASSDGSDQVPLPATLTRQIDQVARVKDPAARAVRAQALLATYGYPVGPAWAGLRATRNAAVLELARELAVTRTNGGVNQDRNAAEAAKRLAEEKMGPITAGLGGLGGGLGLPGM